MGTFWGEICDDGAVTAVAIAIAIAVAIAVAIGVYLICLIEDVFYCP
jgi:hypothetical protein